MTGGADTSRIEKWLATYEQLWRTPGTARLAELFAEDATYQQSPYDSPVVGLTAISDMWEAERQGPDEVFSMSSSLVIAGAETAVVRVDVAYGDPSKQEYRDLWIVRFGPDGRARSFEEWPFWPDKGRTPSSAANSAAGSPR